MTPFGIILVTAVFSTQVMQTITQPKKYRCASFRPLPQPESEPISSFYLRLPPVSATKSQSTTTKSPASVSKSQVSVIKSPSSVSKSSSSIPKSPSSVSKSSTSVTKSSSTVQKVTNSSRTANRLTPDSFSLFKLPLQLISNLLVPLIPSTIRQNTSTVISPQFHFQMPLTFSTVHHPKNIPSDTNNLPVPCNTNNLSTPCNSLPGNTNTLPNPCNTLPGNTNTLPNPCSTLPGNTKTQPGNNNNALPNPCNTLPGNTNTSTSHNNSKSCNTNTISNPCNSTTGNIINNSNYVFCNSLLGNSHKHIIYNWICNYLLNKIQNVSFNTPPIKCISTSTEPNSPMSDNPIVTPIIPTDTTVTPTEDTPTEDTPTEDTPTEDTPKDNSTPDYNIPTTTTEYPVIPPCAPTTRFHTPCLSPIHIPKSKPCSLKVTNSHPHVPLKHFPLHHASCPPLYDYFHPLLNPTIYKSNTDLTNPQEEILLKILKSLIANSNLQSPSTSK